MSLVRHQLGEFVFVAAEIFGDGDGGVVGRFRDHRLDRVFDRERLAGLQAELRRRLLGGVRGNLQAAYRA